MHKAWTSGLKEVRIEGGLKCSKERGDEILTEQPVLEEDVEFHFKERN